MTWHDGVGNGTGDPDAREDTARWITAKRAAKGGTTSRAARKGARQPTGSGVDEGHEHDERTFPRSRGEIKPNLSVQEESSPLRAHGRVRARRPVDGPIPGCSEPRVRLHTRLDFLRNAHAARCSTLKTCRQSTFAVRIMSNASVSTETTARVMPVSPSKKNERLKSIK